MTIDTTTGARTTIAADAANVVAVSADGRVIARVDGDDLRVAADGTEVLRAPTQLSPDDRRDVEISPGGRRVAATRDTREGGVLFVGDLTTGRGVTTALRVHGHAGGVVAVAWVDDRRLVVGGSNAPGDQEGLWLVELDDAGAITGPPVALVAPRRNSIMDVVAIRGRTALVVQVDVVLRLVRRSGASGASAPLPGLLELPLWGADARHERLLLGERGGARVVSLDGSLRAHATGDGHPVLRDGAPWFARAAGGAVELRDERGRAITLPGATEIGAELDRMHCGSGGGCVVSWYADGALTHALVGADGLGPAFEVALGERGLDPSPDATRALVHTDHELAEHDVATGRLRVLERLPTCTIEDAIYTADGSAAVYSTTCGDQRSIWRRALTDGARPRVLERLRPDVDVTHLETLAGDDVVYRTVEYQSRLVRVDGLPLP